MRLSVDKSSRRIRRACACFLAVPLLALACAAPPQRPHIVLVTFDTLRVDHVGVYASGEGHTPNVDAFAADALVHEAAFTTMPTTSPSHASLFTGLHPYQHGVTQNGMSLPVDISATQSLTAKLHDAGYATGGFVTSRVFGPDLMGLVGLESFEVPSRAARPGDAAVRDALAWVDGVVDRPIFLWVHLFDPHSPYGTSKEKESQYPIDRSSYGWVERSRYRDAHDRRQMAAKYARGVREADAAFGQLEAALRERLEPDPVILVTADHGEFLDEHLDSYGFAYGHGSILDEAVLRIPMLIRGRGVKAGTSSSAASIRDLYTTVLEFAGIGDPEAKQQGRRDLRRSHAKPRLVSAERRSFQSKPKKVGSAASAAIRRNVVAVTDGQTLVVVGEDGTMQTEGALSSQLEAAAYLRLEARAAAPPFANDPVTGAGKGPEIDEETRRALKSLGYVH